MKNRILACCIALTLLAGAGVIGAWAQAKPKTKNEVVTKTGVIEITKAARRTPRQRGHPG